MQPVLIRFMKTIHKRKIKPDAFEQLIGRSFEQLDKDYIDFLKVSNRDVEKRIENVVSISALAAPDAKLSDGAFDVLGTCSNLRWLDITGCKFTRRRALKLSRLDLIKELFLTASEISPGSLELLNQLASLQELDLSSSSIEDDQLEELQKIPDLQVLQIANTRVTDAGLLKIAKIPRLKVLDVTGSGVTAIGVERFQQIRDDVKVVQRK